MFQYSLQQLPLKMLLNNFKGCILQRLRIACLKCCTFHCPDFAHAADCMNFTHLHFLIQNYFAVRCWFVWPVIGSQWISKLKQERIAAPCSYDTSLSCEWLQLQCTGGQVTSSTNTNTNVLLHRESKKHATKLFFISSPNIDRF